MGQLFSFLVVIGIIIFIHESGHFTMAKLFRIPVAVFSLGFGPKLFGFRFKETEYKVSAIPLGGYVKIHGMEDQEAAPDDPNSFYNRPRWQRFLVLFMGVGFNFILSIVLITYVLHRGIEAPQSTVVDGTIGAVAPGSPAEEAGLQPGDVILEINNQKVSTWKDVNYAVLFNPGETITARFKRDKEILEKKVQLTRDKERSLGQMGIAPATDVIVGEVTKGMPAEKAGLKKGDVLFSINDHPVRGTEVVPALVQGSLGKPIKLEVERVENGKPVRKTITVTPVHKERWVIGFAPVERSVMVRLPLKAALQESFARCKEHVQMTGLFLSKLLTGKLSLKAASGPFEIAKFSNVARNQSLSTFLLFIGTISFDIGLVNLLPIPALDGGHIFFLLLEGITRREFSVRLKERLTMIGFVFLIGVMCVVLYYDISRTGPIQQLIESFGK
ncbi:MAG TPA: RIP metalloprotease RseP [Acidobacteriota bacterium]|nr:RIP metalloprotease RseP [Acidobacteriota bacterium]